MGILVSSRVKESQGKPNLVINEQFLNSMFYAGRSILAAHTKDGGKCTLHLENGKTVQLELTPISTTFLDNNTGKIL